MVVQVKKLGVDGVHRVVPIALLKVDPSYQRADFINRRVVSTISSDYCPVKFNCLIVGERPDGTLWVVDGQHRMLGAVRKGLEEVPCLVFKSSGPQQEASMFFDLNKTRTSINQICMFRACLMQGEAKATAIQATMDKHGFSIQKNGNKAFACAAAIRDVYEWGVLERALGIMSEAFGDGPSHRWRKMFCQSHFVQMLGIILKLHGDKVDDKRMILVLARYSEAEYIRLVSGCAGATGNRAKRIAPMFIDDVYNRNLSPSKKIAW